MADIKYLLKFGKREHLESLVSGNIYCSNAITFWGIEDKLKIKGQGDILEAGTRMFAQKMIMQHPDTKEVIAKSILLELQSSIFQMIKNRLLGNTSLMLMLLQ